MEFYIGSQFSREFSFEESQITHNLADEMNVFFGNKDYGDKIKNITIGVICVSKGFDPFFTVRPPKVSKKEPTLEYELKLDFDTFKLSGEEKRKQILVAEIFKTTNDVFEKKKLTGFKQDNFLKDLEFFFKESGYLDNYGI